MAKKTTEDKLTTLLEKQRKLSAQIAEQKRRAAVREQAARQAKIDRLGQLAVEAGILDLPDDVLVVAFREISARQAKPAGVAAAKANPA